MNGEYKNASPDVAVSLIDAIGTVGIDGSENCFALVTLARQCYDILSEADRQNVNNYNTLTAAEESYNTVVTKLIGDIDAIGEVTLRCV